MKVPTQAAPISRKLTTAISAIEERGISASQCACANGQVIANNCHGRYTPTCAFNQATNQWSCYCK
jgi:hypothetical protein